MVAIGNNSANEEITFDYAMRNYGVDYFPDQCMCGSKRCRGKITGWRDLPDEKKKEYGGFVAPYLLESHTSMSILKTRFSRRVHSYDFVASLLIIQNDEHRSA